MGTIKNPIVIYFKGMLFLGTGFLATALLFAESVSWRPIALHLISIWCFCRFYYFAFYVIEHYVDKEYRFSGLFDFFRYLMRKQQSAEQWTHATNHSYYASQSEISLSKND